MHRMMLSQWGVCCQGGRPNVVSQFAAAAAVLQMLLQVSLAMRGVGDVDLAGRFDDARERMKRGVVFAASLYL